jgi:hypothetical protein
MAGHRAEALGAGVDHILHPFRNAPSRISRTSTKEVDQVVYASAKRTGGFNGNAAVAGSSSQSDSTYTIPCMHVRIGDVVILQRRPCQVIRITRSSTEQHRYLGVDLFTQELREESCIVSHPSESVTTHTMVLPSFKEYRVIDTPDGGCVTVLTHDGGVKRIPVIRQGNLMAKIKDQYSSGSANLRVLVLSDGDSELVLDYKKVHGGFML